MNNAVLRVHRRILHSAFCVLHSSLFILHSSFFVFLTVAGCSRPEVQTVRLLDSVERPSTSVVVFFVDGMDRVRFDGLLRRGLLPNIERRFVEGGVGIEHAVVSMPAITYASAVSLVTGCFPGHHGILGNRWFDRERLLLRDYGAASTYRSVNSDFDRSTLFEILDDHFTVCVQTHTDRGADVVIDNWVTSGLDWLGGNYAGVDARVGACVSEVIDIANREGRWPSVYLSYFPGLDEIGHRFGADSRNYEQALVTVDTAIGKILNAYEHLQAADATYFVLVTDHGHIVCPDGRTLDVGAWLADHANRRVHTGPLQNTWQGIRQMQLGSADTVLTVDAGRRAAIHVRGRSGWHDAPDRTQINAIRQVVAGPSGLVASGAVVAACYREGSDTVACDMADGTVEITRRRDGAAKTYRCVFRCDRSCPQDRVCGLDAGCFDQDTSQQPQAPSAQNGNSWRDSRKWLETTAGSRLPDFVPQIVEMFDSSRAGDIVLFAADDWSFGWPFDAAFRGAHGSCLDRDMRVPMYFAGPHLPAGASINAARLVDVMPTILDLLGELDRLHDAPPIDGISLLPRLLSASCAADSDRAVVRFDIESWRGL